MAICGRAHTGHETRRPGMLYKMPLTHQLGRAQHLLHHTEHVFVGGNVSTAAHRGAHGRAEGLAQLLGTLDIVKAGRRVREAITLCRGGQRLLCNSLSLGVIFPMSLDTHATFSNLRRTFVQGQVWSVRTRFVHIARCPS
jgi:hypothetical protein